MNEFNSGGSSVLWATASQEDRETMRRDISELQNEAALRLEALMGQMDALQKLNDKYSSSSPKEKEHHFNDEVAERVVPVAGSESMPSSLQKSSSELKDGFIAADMIHHDNKKVDNSEKTKKKTELLPPISLPTGSMDLLDDTTWKMVFNIGRETGTWMPKDWGISGDRLLFQCNIHFSPNPLSLPSNGDDSFFHGPGGPVKILHVSDAFLMPSPGKQQSSGNPKIIHNNNLDDHDHQSSDDKNFVFVGRRPLPVVSMGAYKVCRGQGPAGTDLLRFYIQLTDTVANHDDVTCPQGRVYGTLGYFPTTTPQLLPSTSQPSKDNNAKKLPLRVRDVYQEQYDTAVQECADLQAEVESDTHAMWNMDRWKKVQALWESQRNVKQAASQLRLARMREPERSKLRYTRCDSVGLTAEGGVCCKVHQGLALEYHILGRLQVACIDKELQQQQHHATQQATSSSSTTTSAKQPTP